MLDILSIPTTIILLTTLVWELSKDDLAKIYPLTMSLTRWILAIAGISYLSITLISDLQIREQIRYLDWLLTTPLLVLSYWSIGRYFGYSRNPIPLVLADILMIIFGYIGLQESDPVKKNIYNLISFGWLFYALYELYLIYKFLGQSKNPRAQSVRKVFWFFVLWPLYGFIAAIPNIKIRDQLYPYLDITTKAIYSIVLWNLIK